MNGGSNSTAFQRRLAFALMPRDQEQNSFPCCNGSLQSSIDRLPGPVQRMAMQVEHAIRLQAAVAQFPVPTSIQRGLLKGFGALRLDWSWAW